MHTARIALLLLQALLIIPAVLGNEDPSDVTYVEQNTDHQAEDLLEPLIDLPDLNAIKGNITEALQNLLRPFDNHHIPVIPSFPIEVDGIAKLSLAFTDIQLTGISNVMATNIFIGSKNTEGGLTLKAPHVQLTANQYSSGGNILNLPLNGEGPMSLALKDLTASLLFSWEKFAILPSLKFCVKDNSTRFDFDLRQLSVNLENLNPGTDQGEVVNTVLSSFGPDIFDYLELLVNESKLVASIDDIIVHAVNTADYCKLLEDETPSVDDKIKDVLAHVSDIITTAFEGIASGDGVTWRE